jgi:phenylalanine-4-hydroxylase
MGNMELIQLAQDRDQWQALVNSVMKLWFHKKVGKFFEYLNRFSFLKKDSVPWNYLIRSINKL